MNKPASLLDELRTEYEAARDSVAPHPDVDGLQAIDARLRKAFLWLEKALMYLNGRPARRRIGLLIRSASKHRATWN